VTTRILFVCLGNICRSPMAEGVVRHLADPKAVIVDSAGTSDWHIGLPPDARAIDEAARHGVDLRPLRARQFTPWDFEHFDLILAMDQKNHRKIESLRPERDETPVRLFLEYAGLGQPKDVPDPWYEDNFGGVFEMIEEAAMGLLRSL